MHIMDKLNVALLLKKEKFHNKKVISFLKKIKNLKLFIFEGDINSKYPKILEKKKF